MCFIVIIYTKLQISISIYVHYHSRNLGTFFQIVMLFLLKYLGLQWIRKLNIIDTIIKCPYDLSLLNFDFI